MTLASAAVRSPAPLNEPLHGVVVAVLGSPQSKCHWRVKQLSPGDDAITFCHNPDGANTPDTPWLQNLVVGSLVIYKRTVRSASRFVDRLTAEEESLEELHLSGVFDG